MAEKKPGLLKRIFSFGFGKKQEAQEEVAQPQIEAQAEAAEAESAQSRLVAERAEVEALARAEEAARSAAKAEQLARDEAEALATEAAARQAAEAQEKARQEAEAAQKAAAEQKAREEADEKKALAEKELARRQAEAAAATEAVRKQEAAQEEERQRQEAMRLAEEAKVAEDAARQAAEETARLKEEEAARAQQEKAERQAAERLEREQAERLAREQAGHLATLEIAQGQAEEERLEAAAAARQAASGTTDDTGDAGHEEDGEDFADHSHDEDYDEDDFQDGYVAPPSEPIRIEDSVITLTERKAKKAPEPEPEPEEERRAGWLQRLGKGLSRSSNQLKENISQVFTGRRLDEETLQELEDVLIQADLGMETAMKITDTLSEQKFGREITDREVREVMAQEIEKILEPVAIDLDLDLDHQPHVILVVGVNGSGKTTTIGKLAAKLYDAGFSTTLVAGDTFRAAAIEQLKIWGERTHSPVLSRPLGSDAAGLAYDAWAETREQRRDVMLMDTAGRLQNKAELMAELEKIVRVLKKQDPSAPHTVLLTLDATTGQNALNQVETFKDVAGVNGLVMTKLDGTARGGILVSISAKHKLPVFFAGVGEQVEDLEPFEARDFARSIAGLPPEE